MNFGVLLAGIRISSPVRGFLPVVALRFATDKVPNPVRVTLPPLFKSLVMLCVMASIAWAAAVLVIFGSLVTRAMSSALVMVTPFRFFDGLRF